MKYEEVHAEYGTDHVAGKYIDAYSDEDPSETSTLITVKMPIQRGAVCYWVSSSLVLIPLQNTVDQDQNRNR